MPKFLPDAGTVSYSEEAEQLMDSKAPEVEKFSTQNVLHFFVNTLRGACNL